jgi:hypothetical protein
MLDVGRRAASYIASGSAADRDRSLDLARRLLLGYETRDQAQMLSAIVDGAAILQTRASATDLADLWAQLQAVMAPLPGAAEVFAGTTGLDRPGGEGGGVGPDGRPVPPIRDWLEAWCLGELIPPPPDRERPQPDDREPPRDQSLDPHTDVDDLGRPDDEPGTHEQVPDPVPGTPPGGPGPGPDDAGGTDDAGGQEPEEELDP